MPHKRVSVRKVLHMCIHIIGRDLLNLVVKLGVNLGVNFGVVSS